MTTTSGSPRPEPTLQDRLTTADTLEQQLGEHWQEYAAFQSRLDDLRSAQESLRWMVDSVNAAKSASHGIEATLASLVGRDRQADAWSARLLALASEAVAEVLINTAMHSQATSTQAGLKRQAD